MTTSPKRRPLTKRQREIFEFVRDKIVNRGYGPTVREIGTQFGIRSPNGVMCHLKALEKKGLIIRESNRSRAIKLCNNPPGHQSLVFLGTAVSGGPLRAAISSDERIEFGDLFNRDGQCVIQIEGKGFVSLGIADGDFLIVSQNARSEPDNLVVVLDDRQQVTIYRIPKDGGSPVPAVVGGFESPKNRILGVLAGVVRWFENPPTTADTGLSGTAHHGDLV